MTNQKNVRNLILGKATSVGTGVPAAGTQVEPSNMADGTVVITDLSGKRITTLSSGEGTKGFYVVQGQGSDKPLIKHLIRPTNITSVYSKPYSAATEQVTYIGYNGTSGSLPAGGVDMTYSGATVLQGEFLTFGAREMKKTFMYKCSTSDSSVDVATGLALNIYNGVAKMADPYYKVELVANHAGTATGAVADTVIGAKGSKIVTITDTGANATVIALSAGDFFRAGTGVTDPVYKIVSSTVTTSGGVLTLDRPLTETVNLLGTTSEYITAAQAASASFGIKLTGMPRTYNDITFRFYKIRFAVELFNMGSSTVTTATAANEGAGMSEAIQWLESFTVGNEGAYYVIQPDQPLARRKNSVNYLGSSSGWNLITINYYDATTNNIIGGQKMEKSLTIAGATGTSTAFTDSSTGIIAILKTLTVDGANPDLFPSGTGTAWV